VNKLKTGLIMAGLASVAGHAFAAPVENVASGSVAIVSNGSTPQVFNNLLLDPDANRSNYLVFDLNQIRAQLGGQQLGSATLTITNPGTYATGNASETFSLWDFGGDVNALRNYGFSTPPSSVAVATAVRDDLRSGTSYGSTVINNPAPGSLGPISIVLNEAGVAGLNAALGTAAQFFALGGYANIAGTGAGHYLFISSNGTGSLGAGNARLDVQPVPVPAALWLLGSGVAALGGAIRRRRSATVVAA
jgi:hypothetical protein